jgi:hypothetical protein
MVEWQIIIKKDDTPVERKDFYGNRNEAGLQEN